MKPKAVKEQVRRSKRQAGLDVSPEVSLNQKKHKKAAPEMNEREKTVENFPDKDATGYEEEEQDFTAVMDNEKDKVVDEEVEQHSPTEEEETIPPSTNGVSNTSEAQTEQSENKKRKTRGPTKMRKVAKNIEDKVEVEFNALGEHVGSGSVTLSSFLGPLVREHVPVLLDDWRHLEEKTKDALWEEIQGRFNLTEEWQKDVVFKQMGGLWRASKSRLSSKVRAIKNKVQLQQIKPSNIQSTSAWNTWVKGRSTTAFQEQSDKYRQLRKGQIPHTTSRKGMTRLAHEMKRNSSDPKKVTRTKVWVAGHTHSDGRPVREEFAETIEKIKTIDSEMDSTSTDNIREDAVSRVLGKDRPGRLRGLGRGATVTKLAFLQARDSHVQKLESTQAELLSKLENLQNVVRDLAGKKKQSDDVSRSELSDVSKGGIRCQLLDWFSTDEVVVGEGEYCSSEPTYKIGRIPLGPNAAAVIVKSVSVLEACVWRPTTTIGSLAQAVGVKIAWPSDKIILDDDINFPQHANTVGSEATDASIGRVQIFDYWKGGDELIAEGLLLSTEPSELVNDIPLGPNAAVVKVELVVKTAAFLWRPRPGMSKMGDALHETIAWPIDRLQLPHQPTMDESTKKSTQSGSPSTGSSSKGAKQKCALLDCENSGQTVAVGRVFSTDPADKVHFIPLGPNASKVWVEVSKVDGARVWRPNSEVEFIADAVGSTVAWPNEKIVYI